MKFFKPILVLSIFALTAFGCSDDDDDSNPALNNPANPNPTSVSYDLESLGNSGVSGTGLFTENNDGSITATLTVTGTSAGNSHPAHVHFNTAAEGGGIAISLSAVDGATGTSTTTFNALDNSTPISFSELRNFDGYVNIHLSDSNLATVVAQGDIGQNDLTGTLKTYNLGERAVAGISGTIEFAERINGEALATISLQNTPSGGRHPAHIHMNSAVEGGGIAFPLDTVDGNSGISKTNIPSLGSSQGTGYNDVLNYDGYINVHLSANNLATIVAQGDIGQNELTNNTKTYVLAEKDVPGISGNVVFSERLSGETLAKITLTGTPNGGSHPAHIHMNDATTTGPISFSFPNVDGTSGISETNISQLDDSTPITYSDLLIYDGYINVHESDSSLNIIVAQGNIGSNE